MAIRLAIADDSYLIREALARVLGDDPEFEVVAVTGDSASLRRAIDLDEPDVVLTDIRMPPFRRGEGVEVAAELRATHPEVGVVVLSQYADLAFALRLFQDGSAGRAYLLKERVGNRAEVTAAIRAVAAGDSVVDPRIVDKLIAERAGRADSRLRALTDREREVLAEVASGKSNTAIAEKLVLTKRAVEKHINSIFLKLDLREAEAISRRVTATLIFLAEETGTDTAVDGPNR